MEDVFHIKESVKSYLHDTQPKYKKVGAMISRNPCRAQALSSKRKNLSLLFLISLFLIFFHSKKGKQMHQWQKVMKYFYSHTLLRYNFEELVLYDFAPVQREIFYFLLHLPIFTGVVSYFSYQSAYKKHTIC